MSFYNKKRSELTPYEIGYLENFDALEFSKTKTRLWLSLINTLKVNNISYLATDFIPDTTEEIENLKKSYSYSSLWDAINNDENRITDLEMITRGRTKLPCGHEDYPTMPIIANYIHEEIRKRWH